MTAGAGDQAAVNLAEWAAKYAVAKLPVLPLHSIRDGRCTCRTDCGDNAAKHPLTAHGKDDATTDPAQIAAWLRRWPWANWGIRPPAGIIVLDIDPRNGGDTALLALTQRHKPLPPTLTARTGGSGLHVWLAYDGAARGKLCQGVDVKTRAGYVVAPPSQHLSGQRYEWITQLPTAPAPGWVRQILAPPLRLVPTPFHSSAGCDGLVRMIAQAKQGERNNALNWAAYRAYQRGGPLNLIEEIRAAALAVGLGADEVDRTIASASRGASR